MYTQQTLKLFLCGVPLVHDRAELEDMLFRSFPDDSQQNPTKQKYANALEI